MFSRAFVVGFFAPSFCGLLAFGLAAPEAFLPHAYTALSQTDRVLVDGAAAVILGLVLSGLYYPILRIVEGYPLHERREKRGVALLHRALVSCQKRRFDALVSVRGQQERSPKRTAAAWALDRYFPPSRETLLPTRFGNAVAAFERYSLSRWGLDAIPAWPRIQSLLTSQEQDLLSASEGDVAFFVNLGVVGLILGLVLVGGEIAYPAHSWPARAVYLIPFALGYIAYRCSVGAAVRWGSSVRASIDLHRLSFYEKLGLRRPATLSEERELATAVNRCLLYNDEIDDKFRTGQETNK